MVLGILERARCSAVYAQNELTTAVNIFIICSVTLQRMFMNFTPIVITLPNGYKAKLLFRQYQQQGDWICQVSDECITDLQDLLLEDPEPYILQ